METLIWKCDWNQISPSEINECYAARGYRVLTTQTSANCQFNRNQDPQRDYHFLIRIVDCLNMAPRACRRLLAPSGFGFWDVEYLMYMVRSRVYTVSISLALFISFLRPVLCIFSIIERELIYPYFTLLQKRDLYIDSGWRQNFYSLSNSALMSDGMAVPNLCSAGNVTCLDKFVTELTDLYATDYFGLASFVVLVYDHMLTFDDEVEFIWRRKFSKVSFFFLLNRYLISLGFIVNLVAYFDPAWTPAICHHFVRYEGSMTMIGITIAAILMGLRVSALYHGSYFVKILLASVLLSFVGINSWLLASGVAVNHPGVHGCTMIFSPHVGNWASASAWIPLLYDTIIVFLIILRAMPIAKANLGQNILAKRLLRDGLLYYCIITTASLVLTIMIETASPGIKNICAQFQLLITVTMISRVTLNLRKHLRESNVQAKPPLNARTSTSSTSKFQTSFMMKNGLPVFPPPAYTLDVRLSRRDSDGFIV